MTRRKSVSVKWTLVFICVVCPFVYSRPQDSSQVDTTVSSVLTETTENPLRYRFRYISSKLPIVFSLPNVKTKNESKSDVGYFIKNNTSNNTRTSRLLHKRIEKKKVKPKTRPIALVSKPKIDYEEDSNDNRKPTIKKVITKWTDKTKYEDLHFPHDTNSDELEKVPLSSSYKKPDGLDTKSNKLHSNGHYNKLNRPPPQYSEETQVYSNQFHVIDYPLKRPYYYTTPPTPTPIITNVGYPKPWSQNKYDRHKTTTRKPAPVTEPLKDYDYHNMGVNYPNYDVTTFPPHSAYTEKIIIRPDEYMGSPDDCPTIFLTLNNTFQGQAKEACPDLNIAVNTNVINKNVVIESEEDEVESIFPDAFGIPLGDDSGNDESAATDYFQSEESQGQVESASVEGTELDSYNSANAIPSESVEPGNYGAPSSQISAISKPGRPQNDDDDFFNFSSLLDFFRPAVNLLGWLASINPLSVGLFPLLLTPLAFLFAGSGLAALFSSWFAPYGREAPQIIHLYTPDMRWEDKIKTWNSHSFPNSRRVRPESIKTNNEIDIKKYSEQPAWVIKFNEWMKATAQKLENNKTVFSNHKDKRKKREAWNVTVK